MRHPSDGCVEHKLRLTMNWRKPTTRRVPLNTKFTPSFDGGHTKTPPLLFRVENFFCLEKEKTEKDLMQHSNKTLCSSCRLRKQVDHYERCIFCASKRSKISTSNILLLTEQANAIAKPLRASKRLSFNKEIDDNMLVFTRGEIRFVRVEGLSFRVDCLQYFNVDDLSKMTRHELGHGLTALLDSERRCVLYRGGTEVPPILERVVFAAPGAEGRRFVCSTAGRGVVQFKFPGPSHLPEVYNQRLKDAKDGGFLANL